MTVVLDAGGVSSLAGNRARQEALLRAGMWPPVVPVVVLVEALTGDHRRDFATNRLLALSRVVSIDEHTSREAARLRTATGRVGSISATDALVAAIATQQRDPVVVTSDPDDLTALLANAFVSVRVAKA